MDPRQIDLRLLYALETIHRVGSLTAAGDALGLSQPALSHQLRRLRDIFQDPLFVRTASGMYATPRADELAGSARRIQAVVRAEIGSSAPFHPKSLDRRFNLCMTDVGEMVLLPTLVNRLREEAPQTSITTMTIAPREMVEALELGVADLAIGPFPELGGAALKRPRLFDRGFLALVSMKHPRIQSDEFSLETFLEEPHLVVSSSGRTEEVFEHFLVEQKLKRRVALSVPHMLCVPSVITETDLVATVPYSVGHYFSRYAGLRVLRLPQFAAKEPPMTRVAQFWSTRFDKDPAITWLRRLVAELYQRGDSAPMDLGVAT